MAKATDKREYMNMLWGSSESNDGVFHNTVMDMAWSLHVIAEMLMEQNGYINTYEYMVGKPEHVAEQTEPQYHADVECNYKDCDNCGHQSYCPQAERSE